jgi:hypothetical protein
VDSVVALMHLHRVFWLGRIERLWSDSLYAVIWWIGRASLEGSEDPLAPKMDSVVKVRNRLEWQLNKNGQITVCPR